MPSIAAHMKREPCGATMLLGPPPPCTTACVPCTTGPVPCCHMAWRRSFSALEVLRSAATNGRCFVQLRRMTEGRRLMCIAGDKALACDALT